MGFGCLLMAGIWWWGTRPSGQARGKPDVVPSPPPAGRTAGSAEPAEATSEYRVHRDWGVPPLEPLNVRMAAATARETEPEVEADEPGLAGREVLMIEGGAPLEDESVTTLPEMSAESAQFAVDEEQLPVLAASPAPSEAPAPPSTGEPPARSPPPANVGERQRIVTLRVSAAGDSLWSGRRLVAVFEAHGLSYGRYQVFHRKYPDGRTLFCVASLVEPGTFDVARMPEEEFRGLTLFAVLPGPATPLQTFDALLTTAGELAHSLGGVVQDGKGRGVSEQIAVAMREDVARFQASLP